MPGAVAVRTVIDAGVEFAIPSRCLWFEFIFISGWLLVWGFGEFMVVKATWFGSVGAATIFLMGWLVAWTAAGVRAIFWWLWMLAGKDTVSIQPPTLGLKRTILGIGWWREYDLNQVRNLRVWASNRRRAGIEVGRIAFDYGFKTFRFGDGVESAEAEEIVRELKRHSSIA